MKTSSLSRISAALSLCVVLAACSSNGPSGVSPTTNSSAGQGSYKVGQPYQIGGEWFYPKEDYSYDETGIASWYGADFHDQATANGEIFNKNELTAAHKTLPLPTLARVTNLDNGRSIVVRINDRGPFSGARIIDVSQRAAQLLGFEGQGTAKVRVQVLADESKAIADAMRHYGGNTQVAAAASETPMPLATTAPEPQITTTPLAPLATAPVKAETLAPIRTTAETHQQLIDTQPVAQAVQLPVTGQNRIYIQAGAFTREDNAERMKASLSRYGSASISTITINGTQFYRVRVGPISDVAHADALISQMKKAGNTNARTVVD